MGELRTDSTTDDIARLEDDLRRLYGSVIAPPSPARWMSPRMRFQVRPRRDAASRTRVPRRVAAVALAAVAVLVTATLANRSPLAPQPVLAVQMQPAGSNLVCKLPVAAVSGDEATGFIVMDHGHATFQPVRTKGTTYVPALGVWAPVLPQLVAPDGRAYLSETFLYGKPGGVVISVTDARGTRKLLQTTGPDFIAPLGYTASGDILVVKEGPGPWHQELLDPATGALHSLPFKLPLVGGVAEPGYMRNGSGIEVWYVVFVDDVKGLTTISRFDPSTGQMTEWFNSTDAVGTAAVVGTDSMGSFIIQVAERDIWHTALANRSGIRIRTMLLTSPHHITVLNDGRAGDPGVAGAFSPLSATMGDEVWLASDDGAIWLYRTGVGLQQIAKVTTSNQGAPGVAISGACS